MDESIWREKLKYRLQQPPKFQDSRSEGSHGWRTSSWVLLVIASIAFSALALSYSSQYGRLLFEVDYEDVITHLDGLERYRDFADGGVVSFLSEYVKTPPHAPLHSMMAAGAFAVFGVHDWAPYAANVFVLFGLFGAVLYVIRPLATLPVNVLAIIFAAGFPITFLSIYDFRPDYPAAVFSVWGVLLLMNWNPLRNSRLQGFLAGGAFACALLAKPTVFPYTVALGGAVLAVALLRAQTRPYSFARAVVSIGRTWPFFVANIVIALPHFIVAGPRLVEYMIRNQIGADKASWSLKGSFFENSAYHLLGYSGSFQLGDQRWIALGLVVVGSTLMIFSRPLRNALFSLDFPVLTGIAGIALFGVAINHHGNPYFGLVFQILLILLALLTLAAGWNVVTTRNQPWRFAGICLAGLLFISPSLLGSPWPRFRHAEHRAKLEVIKYARSVNEAVYRALSEDLVSADQANVLITTYGIVSNHTLQWLADKEMVPLNFVGLPNKSEQDLIQFLNQRDEYHPGFDFVVATEPGAYGVHDFLPSARTAGFMLKQVRENPEFFEIGHIPVPDGTSVRIFQRKGNFGGWTAATGLSARLPAMRDGNVPVRQFGYWPAVDLRVIAKSEGAMSLVMRWMPVKQGTNIEIFVNEKLLRVIPAPADRRWQEEDITFSVIAGENHIALRFVTDQPHEQGRTAVTFTRLVFKNEPVPPEVEQTPE